MRGPECVQFAMLYTCKVCGWSGEVKTRPRCLACQRTRTKRWRQQNPEAAKQQRRIWELRFRQQRPDEYNARRRLKRSKERMRISWQNRREWLESGDVTASQLKNICSKSGSKCVYCGEKVVCRFNPLDPRGFDHVVPRARGGKHTASNLVVSCGACNAVKADK